MICSIDMVAFGMDILYFIKMFVGLPLSSNIFYMDTICNFKLYHPKCDSSKQMIALLMTLFYHGFLRMMFFE